MNGQNVIDILAIIYTQVYNILRVIMPSSSFLSDFVPFTRERFKNIYLAMPLLHTLMLFAIFGQLHFFLQLNSDLAKFLRLF